jgi:MEDS: MEthanogen/methylotroph, DcmR Sensory domain
MSSPIRHQCLIYEGPPSRHLTALAAVICEQLQQNYRCLYLNSRPMIVALRSYLAATGLDVLKEIARGRLILTSDQSHLLDGRFDVERMMQLLRDALDEARREGYAGLWASGDMTWEFGPEKDYSRLLDYEWRLEEFLRENPDFGGICQYHAGTLPREYLRQGLVTHPLVFVNEAMSHINPGYLSPAPSVRQAANSPEVEKALARFLLQDDPS